jgi:hypothetical protein
VPLVIVACAEQTKTRFRLTIRERAATGVVHELSVSPRSAALCWHSPRVPTTPITVEPATVRQSVDVSTVAVVIAVAVVSVVLVLVVAVIVVAGPSHAVNPIGHGAPSGILTQTPDS